KARASSLQPAVPGPWAFAGLRARYGGGPGTAPARGPGLNADGAGYMCIASVAVAISRRARDTCGRLIDSAPAWRAHGAGVRGDKRLDAGGEGRGEEALMVWMTMQPAHGP